MSERRSSGWASLKLVEGRKTVYALGESLTVRGYVRGDDRFRGYGLINIKGTDQ